jgi:hypothetical protein
MSNTRERIGALNAAIINEAVRTLYKTFSQKHVCNIYAYKFWIHVSNANKFEDKNQ